MVMDVAGIMIKVSVKRSVCFCVSLGLLLGLGYF